MKTDPKEMRRKRTKTFCEAERMRGEQHMIERRLGRSMAGGWPGAALAVALAFSLVALGCQSDQGRGPAGTDVIKIGAYFPMTGPYAAGGQMTMDGINLAHQRRPKVLGRTVQTVLVDNKSDKVESANAVSRLIENEGVVAVIGAYASSNAMAGAEVCEKARIPMISPSATNPLVTAGKMYAFRACFIDPFQGLVMAKYATETLGARTAIVIQDVAADYSVGLASFFKRSFTELTGDPGSILATISYQTGDQDFTAQLTVARSKNADVIFIPGYFGDIALLAKQAKELGIGSHLLAGDAAQAPELIQIGGDAVEGLVFSNHYAPEQSRSGAGKEFVDAFREAYGDVPNAFAALGYDAYNIVLSAIESQGEATPEAIRKGIAALTEYDGVTGVITIDENGDAKKSAVILTVQDGKFTYLDTVTP